MKQRNRNSYKADLLNDLKDSEYAAEYLSASMNESVETFLLALRDVADAKKGMTRIASDAHVNRENLYRMLSGGGNPTLNNLHAVLTTLGLKIVVESLSTKDRIPAVQKTGDVVVTSAATVADTAVTVAQGDIINYANLDTSHAKLLQTADGNPREIEFSANPEMLLSTTA